MKTDKNTTELIEDFKETLIDEREKQREFGGASRQTIKAFNRCIMLFDEHKKRQEHTLKSSEVLVEKVQELKRYIELNTDNVSWVILHGRINCILSILSTITTKRSEVVTATTTETASEWISVEDRLPEHGQHVLVWDLRDNVYASRGNKGDDGEGRLRCGDAVFFDEKIKWECWSNESQSYWNDFEDYISINGPRYRWSGHGPCSFRQVTHWMQLPQPPTQDNEWE